MKIYQIHEYGGAWEDFFDIIVGSYVSEDKALIEKQRLEEVEAHKHKCDSCPLAHCEKYMECDGECGSCNHHIDRIEKAKTYCNDYKPIEKSDDSDDEYYFEVTCVNFNQCYDEVSYQIEEVDVVE